MLLWRKGEFFIGLERDACRYDQSSRVGHFIQWDEWLNNLGEKK